MTTTINRKRRISSTIAQAEPLGKEMNGKTRRMCAFLVVLTGFAVVASIFIGSRFIPIGQMLSALNGTGNQELHSIVWDLRMPRTFLAFAAGAALAVAGILAQAWTRNPLADPGFIGVTSGAAFAVALGSLTGLASGLGGMALLAFIGAGLAAGLVMMIARRTADPVTLILIGLGVDATLRAGTVLIGLFDTDVLDSMRHWVVGSTFGRGYDDVALAWGGLSIGLLLALLAARPLDLLAMGDDASLSLGGAPMLARQMSALGVVVLAGSATAAAGPIAFVGFAAPHLMRAILGPEIRRLILPSALLGGVLVLCADIVGRLVIRPGELEMSIVIAFIGAPLFIAVVRKRSGWGQTGGTV